jgi:ADP-ribosyl-[dinitrogen reductase] hydrolase
VAVSEQDRVAGALVGLAVGDALGAGYEFTTPAPDAPIDMIGGGLGPWAPGEWTDDTQQAIAIAEVTATGRWDPVAIGARFLDWYRSGPKDVGVSTAAVLGAAASPEALHGVAAGYFVRHPKGAAGNGSLMRTAPVALSALGDDQAIVARSREASALTHGDPLAAEACVIWGIAIDRAVRHERLHGARDAIDLLPPGRRDVWTQKLDEAERRPPATFRPNGFVVTALQAAYAVITQTPVNGARPEQHFADALVAAVRVGHDTDTVAAIAGQVLGARWGISGIPSRWREPLHGWPGYTAGDLERLAVLTASAGSPPR